jgi:hypothetical protein
MSLSQKDLNALTDLTSSMRGSKGRVSLNIELAKQLPKSKSMKTLGEEEITAENADSLRGVMIDCEELCSIVDLIRLENTEDAIGDVTKEE